MKIRTLRLTVLFVSMLSLDSAVVASAPDRLSPELVATPKTEINFQVVDSEDLGVFTRAEADYSDGKIYLAKIEDGQVTSVEKISFSDPRYKDSDPWLSPSGNELYFISNRPAFVGDVREDPDDYDIWTSRRTGVHWTAPEHFESVNSTSGEFGPELKNGYLYFSSRKSGHYKIYRARKQSEGFSEPELLPEPINSAFLDSDFTLSKDGRVALWWSTRPGGYGSGDIYVSRLTDDGWTAVMNLGPDVNSADLDFTPSLSPNNATLYFSTNKPFPGQEAKASDPYEIAVKDVPALREAVAASALKRLKAAFGGDSVLSNIETLFYRLEIDRGSSGSNWKDVYIDFSAAAIAERTVGEDNYRFARVNHTVSPTGEGEALVQDRQRKSLLATLTSNFLFYLTADDLALIGPENISGHGDLTWFRLKARGETSPLVGLDPANGRIVKVLTDSGTVVLELDYQKDDGGFIWPYRFVVIPDNEPVLTGHFSNLSINGAAPENAPIWFSAKR